MSDQTYTDYRFKFAATDCARVVPTLIGMRNMLGEPLDDAGGAITDPEQDAAFHGARIGDDIYIAFRSVQGFNAVPELTEITGDEAAAILGVWA